MPTATLSSGEAAPSIQLPPGCPSRASQLLTPFPSPGSSSSVSSSALLLGRRSFSAALQFLFPFIPVWSTLLNPKDFRVRYLKPCFWILG